MGKDRNGNCVGVTHLRPYALTMSHSRPSAHIQKTFLFATNFPSHDPQMNRPTPGILHVLWAARI